MTIKREGPFWDAMEGRIPPPPAAELLGFELLQIDPELGTILIQFDAKPEFANPMGVIQGGFLVAMLDDTLGPALVGTLEPGYFAPTIEIKANFLRSARTGGKLIAEGRVVSRGGTIAFLEGELRDQEGALLVTATATARIVKGALKKE